MTSPPHDMEDPFPDESILGDLDDDQRYMEEEERDGEELFGDNMEA